MNLNAKNFQKIVDSIKDCHLKAFSKMLPAIMVNLDKFNRVAMNERDVIKLAGIKNRGVTGVMRKRLEEIDFWVKIKRSNYMVNPELMNNQQPYKKSHLIDLYKRAKECQL